jgi:type VI secretion system protein ImpE
VGLISTRYPGSETSGDDGIRLARKTDWVEHAAQVFAGLGQRMLATDAGEYALMDLRRIDLEAVVADQGAAPTADAPATHG